MANLIARIIAWALKRKPVRALLLYLENRGPILADSVTYRTLFSVFAGVLLGFSVAGLFLAGNPEALQALTNAVDAAIPGLVGEDGIIDPASIQIATGLTVTTVLSIVGLVGAAIGAIGSLRAALRALADKLTDDVFWIWVIVRNLVIAIGIGAAFAASAVITFYANAGIGALTEVLGLSEGNPLSVIGTRAVSVILVFVLDAAAIAVLFRTLSGVRPTLRALLPGTFYGAIGLSVLQQLSSLFVGGAAANPAPGVVRIPDRAAAVVQPVRAGHPARRRLHHHQRRRGGRSGERQVRRIHVRAAPGQAGGAGVRLDHRGADACPGRGGEGAGGRAWLSAFRPTPRRRCAQRRSPCWTRASR